MSSHGGPGYLAIPGPSVIPQAVLNAMHRPAPNIYTQPMVDLTRSLQRDIAALAGTAGQVAMYIGNGHAAWEAALVNTLAPGDRALVLATGRFGHGWAVMARALGIELTVLDFGMEATVDLGALEQALADRTIRAVLLVHVDTASSVRNDVAAVRAVMDRLGHPALLMIDCIASFGCDAVAMDAWGADLMVTACQKGLMTPPGVALVAFNDRAAQARARLTRVSAYWDWQPRVTSTDLSGFWDGTAPTHHLFGLRAALDLIAAETPAAVLARHARLARAVWAACQGWASAGPLRLNIADPALRSHAVTSVHLPGADRLQDWCEAHLGLTLGVGLGREPRGDWFRIGHMGHVNGQMILSVLGGIETGLTALGIPHGPGVTAAAKVLAA